MASVPSSVFQIAAPEHHLSAGVARLRRMTKSNVIRRRPTPAQGRSLEVLGHAIEYLVDSDFTEANFGACPPASEAVQILMRLNREVFADCKEIVPFWQRLRVRFYHLFERKQHHGHAAPVSGPRT